MSSAGRRLLGACAIWICLLAGSHPTAIAGQKAGTRKHPKVITDGRLRPGHMETIRVSGFPGKGSVEVSFFPTAICEDKCGARTFRGGRTNAKGEATFRVRVPGTFLDQRNHPSYFRDGERIDLEVTWEGPGHSFAFASQEPEPIIVRSHGARSARAEALPIPGAFRLHGSNGYTLDVVAAPPRAGRSGRVLIFASAKNMGVRYSAPATVTETTIQADLGKLGEIDMTYKRNGQAASVPCGKRKLRFASGQYEGKAAFHGEEDYTSIEATTAQGLFVGFCGATYFEGGSARYHGGAALYVRNPALGPELSVRKSRPDAAAEIGAWTSEYNDEISIQRYVSLRMPAADFTYDRRLRTATVHPPAPFSGSARFDLGRKAGQRWSGDLTVDLPGRSGVPLTGPTLRATLSPSE